ERKVNDLLTPYNRPQEAGSRTGVRWAEVRDERGTGLRFAHEGEMEFSALPWTPFEIENARHHSELPASHRTVLRPALMRRGVGGDNARGAQPHPEHRWPRGEEQEFRFSSRGVMYGPGAGSTPRGSGAAAPRGDRPPTDQRAGTGAWQRTR